MSSGGQKLCDGKVWRDKKVFKFGHLFQTKIVGKIKFELH